MVARLPWKAIPVVRSLDWFFDGGTEVKPTTRILAIVFLLVASGPKPAASPLFEDDSKLDLTIEAPVRELTRKRLKKSEYDAIIRYTDVSGQEHVLKGRLTSRGNARLEACDFPPLRLEFHKSDTQGTVFEGQKRLKMVTQCNRKSDAEKWLLQELGIYRAYNELTDYSYRVRRLDVTYIDSKSSRWKKTQPAFFIESTDEVAERLQLASIRPPGIEPVQYNRTELSKYMLFQLLIANTDFSVKKGPAGEGCCHNGRVLTEPGEQKGWTVVPYDFDQAGLINTEYALPDRRLGIRSVDKRLYRGFCWHSDSLPDAIALFSERREAITSALIPTELTVGRQSRMKRFIDRFYGILEDPEELRKRITDKCRGADTFPIRKTTSPGN